MDSIEDHLKSDETAEKTDEPLDPRILGEPPHITYNEAMNLIYNKGRTKRSDYFDRQGNEITGGVGCCFLLSGLIAFASSFGLENNSVDLPLYGSLNLLVTGSVMAGLGLACMIYSAANKYKHTH